MLVNSNTQYNFGAKLNTNLQASQADNLSFGKSPNLRRQPVHYSEARYSESGSFLSWFLLSLLAVGSVTCLKACNEAYNNLSEEWSFGKNIIKPNNIKKSSENIVAQIEKHKINTKI